MLSDQGVTGLRQEKKKEKVWDHQTSRLTPENSLVLQETETEQALFLLCVQGHGSGIMGWEYTPLVGGQNFQKTPAVDFFCAREPPVGGGEWATGHCVDATFSTAR